MSDHSTIRVCLGCTSGEVSRSESKAVCRWLWQRLVIDGKTPLTDGRNKNYMSEIFEPASDSLQKTTSASGAQARPGSLTHLRQEPAKTFSIILVGSIVVSVLLGYWISHIEEQSRRQRLMEDWMREVTDWIKQHGRKIAGPIGEGLEATKSALAGASHSSARVGRRLHPFLNKQKRSFLNLF